MVASSNAVVMTSMQKTPAYSKKWRCRQARVVNRATVSMPRVKTRKTKDFQKLKTKGKKGRRLLSVWSGIWSRSAREHGARNLGGIGDSSKYNIFNDFNHQQTWSTWVTQTITDVGENQTQGLRTLRNESRRTETGGVIN